MPSTLVTRRAQLPDGVRLNRYLRLPELGPKILFFSGGTALNGVSRELKHYSHHSIHLVTPFDSGGSSAKLREAFAMPSVGDLRSRMMALADDSVVGNPEVVALFSHRLSSEGAPAELLLQLQQIQCGSAPLSAALPNPVRQLIANQLAFFLNRMPDNFDLRGASIGNLILAGGYLNHQSHLDPIVYLFSKLVNLRGTVRTIVNDDVHLGAILENGAVVLGQHRLTGKEVAPLESPIKRLFLNRGLQREAPCRVQLAPEIAELIATADLIVYPMGSFYTSLIANLLPDGVADAIAANSCAKIFIPNLLGDPEQLGMGVNRAVDILLTTLRQNYQGGGRLLDFLLLDTEGGDYAHPIDSAALTAAGIQLLLCDMTSPQSRRLFNHRKLTEILLSLA
ncbi:MAG: GAK system CofD-like protein [Gammaproteobacteria bacterium]|nr:GAK system CofD-like protein [Gammaproteobacteria bacterium]